MLKLWRLGVLPLVALGAMVSQAIAQNETNGFYKGRTITMMVGSPAGGGYDLYARMIARYMGQHLRGNPAFVVQNMPGAGSNVAAAYIYNVAPKDGTVIGALFMGAVVDPLFGEGKRSTHDASRFNYIGNANSDAYVCLVRTDSAVKSLSDAFEKELILGASGEGAGTRDYPTLLRNLLGVKFKIVTGYPGTREINLALESGEVQGGCGQTWSSVATSNPQWFKNNAVKPLVQESNAGYPALDRMGVPLVRDFAKTDEQRKVLELFYSQATFGRPYVVAPDVPSERVAELRKAFMDTMTGADLVAEARRVSLDIDALSGEVVQAELVKMYAAPVEIVELTKAALRGKPAVAPSAAR